MKLSVLERLVIERLLPKESDFSTLRIVRDLKQKLSFSEDELNKLKIKVDQSGNMTWSQAGNQEIGEVEFEIPQIINDYITKQLEDLDEKKKLKDDLFTIYEKFVKE